MVRKMPSVAERLATLEANAIDSKSTNDKLAGYLERSAAERTQQYTQLITGLATVTGSLENMRQGLDKYQTNCEDDRKDLSSRISTNSSDIAAIKSENRTNKWWNTGVAGLAAAVITGTFEFFKR